jgi:steroid delta-isomerase-like uncharacterized protein/uncharacterized protein (TIGR02246 family)
MMVLAAVVLAAVAPAAVPSVAPSHADRLAEMVRAVNAGDARAYAALYAPGAVITIHGGDVLRGRPAIEEYEVALLREFPGARLGFREIWRRGDEAVVHYAVAGRTPGGQSMGHEGLLFYRFLSSGLIAEERRYLDSLTPMAQLGALGPVATRALPEVPARAKATVAAGEPDAVRRANAALVRTSLESLDAGDQAAFLAAVADDAVIDEMIEPQPFVGKDGVRRWLDRWTRAVSGAKTEIATLLAVDDAVLVEAVVRGTLGGTLGPVSAAGQPFSVHRALIVRIKDGQMTRMTAFMNGKELAQAVGRWPLPAGATPGGHE